MKRSGPTDFLSSYAYLLLIVSIIISIYLTPALRLLSHICSSISFLLTGRTLNRNPNSALTQSIRQKERQAVFPMFYLLVVLVQLSMLAKVIDWKNLPPK